MVFVQNLKFVLLSVLATSAVADPPHLGTFSMGAWHLESGGQGWEGETPVLFGLPGDTPLLGNLAGGDEDELVIYRDGWWWIDVDNNGWSGEGPSFQYGGQPGDVALLADLNGDGRDEPIIYRFGDWYVDWELDGWNGEGRTFQFGGVNDVPVVGDLNHDGIDEIGVVRGDRWIMDSGYNGWDGEGVSFRFGDSRSIPLIGDIDGDGRDEAISFRDGRWRVRGEKKYLFGLAGHLPVVGNVGDRLRGEILPRVVFIPETHKGLFTVTANGGPNLLRGCGFGFIGSESGPDNSANITSCRWRRGAMRQFEGNRLSLASELHFVVDPNYPRKIYFGGSVGPSSEFDFATLSMPMDANRDLFTHFRHDGTHTVSKGKRLPSLSSFDQLRPVYQHEETGQWVRIGFANGNATWGEIIGETFTIRVVLTGTSRNMTLAFVDHPGINVRNVEFGFGALERGQREFVTGHIEVFRTDPQRFLE